MIMCEWHQLVYLANHQSQQTDCSSRFSLPITVCFGNKAQNAKFSAKEQHQKLHISIVNV